MEEALSDGDSHPSHERSDIGVRRRDLVVLGAATALRTGFGTAGATASAFETVQDDGGEPSGLFFAALTGDQQLEPVETTATGGAVVSLSKDGSELEYAVLANAIRDATQAHIHLGSDGDAGPVVAWLYPGPDATGPEPQAGRFDGVLAPGAITADTLTGDLEGESLDAIRDGSASVIVHTETHPDGEIGGRLVGVEEVAAALSNTDSNDEGTNADESVEPVDVPEDATCAVCNMVLAEFPDRNAQLVYEDSERVYFCSPGRMAAYYVVPEQFGAPDAPVAGIWARDFETRELIDGFEANFVLETDPDRVEDPMRLNPLPFADEAEATAYVEQYDDLDRDDVVPIDEFERDVADLYRGRLLDGTDSG
ncbi:CHRD domain-containing protein [Natrinema caseinilyticum]|uniref:CHRD domain-containing protein n=1 Tax=Natrinema caseinilyticum TaxID=2961570 RepID=UPI0020C44931|nr:CHRD domain-containing protein [Natrinema caseinilyticum]